MAPPVALAKEWDGRDPTGYLVSEKLDGMRCWWDGFRLLTRNGHVISAPIHMVGTLPKGVVLDTASFLSDAASIKRRWASSDAPIRPREIGQSSAT